MTTFTILRKSAPASPRADVKFTPVWRIQHKGLDYTKAKAMVDSLSGPLQKNRMIVADHLVRDYL
jgi:hypothetical protein